VTAGPDTVAVAVAETAAAAWLRWLPRALAALTFAGHALIAPADEGDAAFAAIAGTADPVTPVIARAIALVPIGAPAYRLAVASALGAALAVLLIARLVAAAGKDDAATVAGSAAGGLLAALALPLVHAGTHAGSASWLAAAVAATLLLGHQVALGAGAGAGLGAMIVVGLAIAIDGITAALLVPLVVLLILRLRRGARWPLAAPALLALALTAALAQPLVRAATGRAAAIDHHAPRTALALAAQRTPTLGPPPPPDALARWLEDGGDALGPLGIAAALVGAAALLAPRTRWLGAAALVAIAAGAAGELLAGHAAGAALAFAGAAVLVGAGVTRVARAIPIASGQAAVGGALALLVAAGAALATAHRLSDAATDEASSAEAAADHGNTAAGP
jgi:hypothetical protein